MVDMGAPSGRRQRRRDRIKADEANEDLVSHKLRELNWRTMRFRALDQSARRLSSPASGKINNDLNQLPIRSLQLSPIEFPPSSTRGRLDFEGRIREADLVFTDVNRDVYFRVAGRWF
jgi:hypothetical protein